MKLIIQELRNRIYNYTNKIEDEFLCSTTGVVPVSHLPRRQSEWTSICKRRKFLGLTQVCRQIHLEYLPIYKTSLNSRIQPNLYQVYDYIDDWVMSTATSKDDVLGRVILEFKDIDIDGSTAGMETVKALDIWPLLKL